jgi:Bacteriophage CII protein
MTEVSADVLQAARKIQSLILQALAAQGQTKVAATMGVNPSTITRIKDEKIEQLALFLASLGLKLVTNNSELYDAPYIAALTLLASRGLQAPAIISQDVQ